jgi:hypothetical protein|uniref:ORF38 n=1 Tax=Nitrosopumilaceae spindle-shaped virus TaxID=3065433 RepID=A0AAT9J7F9_9VIRU
MAQSDLEKELTKQYEDAKSKSAGEVATAQIEVYEGQTYEAKNAYQEAKAKRSTARGKLPEKIPDDKYYKERLLEAQYIKARVSSPEQREEIDDYTTEIKKQQKAHATVQVLDKAMPSLYSSAVEESKAIETKVEKARVTELKRQEELFTGFQTAITTEQKSESARIKKIEDAEAKRVADITALEAKKTAEAKALADSRQAMFDSTKGIGKNMSNELHYYQFAGLPFEHGDVIAKDRGRGSRWSPSWNVSPLYYERASDKFGITPEQARDASLVGARTQSGKARDNALRAFQDANDGGNRANQYAQNRALAKKTTASAYGSMSAIERSTSSALASEFATNPDAKKKNDLGVLHETSGGLIGKSIKDTGVAKGEPSSFKVYETNEKLYKSSNGLLGKKDVTAKVMPIIEKQRETELANRRQQQYVEELRAGNIGIATALTNPQTTQSYQNTSTVNLKAYLDDRKIVAHTTSDSLFSADVDKRGMGVKVTGKEVTERKQAQERIDVFKPTVYNTQKVEGSTAVKFTNLSEPTVGTLDSGGVLTKKDFNPYSASDPIGMAQGYKYTVPSKGVTAFPTLTGQTFDAKTPTSFDTMAEAKAYLKESKPKLFSGTDNEMFNRWNYPSAVDTGEVIHPSKTKTLYDDVRLGFGYVFRPTYNIGATVYNLAQPENKQVPIFATAEDKLIGGTITDVMDGTPLKGTGVTGFADYVVENPLRALAEVPSAVVTGVLGGKAVTYGVKGVSAGVKASTKLGNKIIQSEAPTIIKVPTMAVMGAGQAVQRVGTKISAVPVKIGSAVYDYGTIPRGMKYGTQVFTTPQQVVRQGIVRPYDSATMFQGNRVGFGAKANFILTPSGRMFVRQSTDIAGEIGAKPQFLNRQVAMFENENVVGFATRGKMKTTKYEMPKETPFKSDVFTPTGKTKLIPKETPYSKPLDSVTSIRIGKPDIQTPTVTSPLKKPDIFDRIKSTTLYRTKVSTKQYKTNIDEVTFYSDTTGDLVKGVKRPKAELQGEGVNYRGFEKPEITGTRTRLQDYKTSTSQSTIKGQLKYSEVAGGKIKFKGSPIRQVDTIVTGAKLTGKKNLKLIDDMVEEGQIEEVGKKTVMKGTDYFGGGKKAGQLKQSLESRNPTTYEAQSGKIKPKDETILYGVSKGKIPVDKKAFAQTMKESNLLREMADKAPLNKKPVVPKGVDEPVGKYHAFVGESKSTGKTFQGTRIELGSGIGTTGVGSSFTKTNVDLGKGGGISNIKDVKGMSSKPDVVGVTTNRINVKKFEEPKIQKGDKIVDGKEGSTVQRTKLDTFQETKIKLGQSAVAKPAQIQVPKVKASVKSPKVSPKVKQIVTPTVSQKTGTGLVQETAQLTKQQTKQQSKIKQSQRLRAIQSQVAVTAVVARTAQIQATATMTPSVLQRTVARKPAVTMNIDLPVPERKPRKTKRGKKAGFIGNVRLDNVMGMYKRKEITYGQKKVKKLERQDMRLTAGTSNRISMPASGLLKTKKKKKKKTETVFGRTVAKTRDEFSGFVSKPKGKKKGKKKTKSTKVRLM